MKKPWKSNGERLGGYEVLSRLSSGGMGALYLARRVGAGGFEKSVAIKVVHPHLAEDGTFVQMFQREARLTTRINHPNVVKVDELREEDGVHFLVMEYVDGCTLAHALYALAKRGRAFRPEIAVWIVMQLADGLHAAHTAKDERGETLEIVHRDVSPHNALVSFTGHVKLIDFGIAKVRGSHTTTGSLKGKVRYMSPEQAQGKPVDRRSDIYALGIVLWELLTHRRRFGGDNDFATLEQVRTAENIPANKHAKISDALNNALARALEPNADLRYDSARDFRRALQQAFPEARAVEPEDVASLLNHLVGEHVPHEPTISRVEISQNLGSGEEVIRTLTLEERDLEALRESFMDGDDAWDIESAATRVQTTQPSDESAFTDASTLSPEPSSRPRIAYVTLGLIALAVTVVGAWAFTRSEPAHVTVEPVAVAVAPQVVPIEPEPMLVDTPEHDVEPETEIDEIIEPVALDPLDRAHACDELPCVLEALGESPQDADELAFLIDAHRDASEHSAAARLARTFLRLHPSDQRARVYRRRYVRRTSRPPRGATIINMWQ